MTQNSELKTQDSGLRTQDSELRTQDLGLRIQDSRHRKHVPKTPLERFNLQFDTQIGGFLFPPTLVDEGIWLIFICSGEGMPT